MAVHRRSTTACGAGRSGSPIERLMTSIPAARRSAIFCFALAKWYGGRSLIKLDSCTKNAPSYSDRQRPSINRGLHTASCAQAVGGEAPHDSLSHAYILTELQREGTWAYSSGGSRSIGSASYQFFPTFNSTLIGTSSFVTPSIIDGT